ncbi:4570_t:CDS:2 [Cetraspora pellucida]|uniref:4570_t:CDS:1 n=1 Tax=Cetraspora pellucida TaxID=1433469 RepID=A0ACA9NVT8_9GLOM|nr:4570_t:CDS:2 [Cetraspora pellucida]
MEPFATCIIHGPKRLENRTYPLDISSLSAKSGASASSKGVWIAIHVSSSKRNLSKNDPTCSIIRLQCWEQLPSLDELKQKNHFGKIIGVARSVTFFGGGIVQDEFIDCLKAEDVPDDNVWKGDYGSSGSGRNQRYCWIIDEVRALERLIECKGNTGIWKVDDQIAKQICEEIELYD